MSEIAVRNIVGEERNVVLVRLEEDDREFFVPFSEVLLNEHGRSAVIAMAEGLVKAELAKD